MNVVIEVRGAREAALALEALRDGLSGACAAGLTEGVSAMADGARRLCPVDTGDLKASISARSQAAADGADGAVVRQPPAVVEDVHHAGMGASEQDHGALRSGEE